MFTVAFIGGLTTSVGDVGAAQSEAIFPFVLPWDDAAPGVNDLSGWHDKPAGARGHVVVGPGGHFYTGGKRIRFLGVNLSFAGGMPAKEDADRIAARLAKFGVNVVRFHHMDTRAWPDGIRKRGVPDTGQLDPDALDRLGWFISRLKARGIYANLNLLVGRPFNAGDGLPREIEALDWKERHVVGFFDTRQLYLQQHYARKLLGWRNPYTGLTLAEDPAVAFVEINNENGLVHAWLGGSVDRLPEVFREELRRKWNRWLQQRYHTTPALQAVWDAQRQPLGRELLPNGAYIKGLTGWSLEQHQGARGQVELMEDWPAGLPRTNSQQRAVRVTVERAGTESWHLQLTHGAFPVEKGKAYTLSFWGRSRQPRPINVSVNQAHAPWQALGLSARAALSREWRRFHFVFVAPNRDTNARVTLAAFGQAGSIIELAGFSLRPGGVQGLKTGERLELGNLPVFPHDTFGERTVAAQRDWIRFLEETEAAYWREMYRFLKNDVGVKALVTGTIVGCSTPNLMAQMDWVDTHAYWQHPRFPGRPWDPENWIVENRSMVNERGGTLPGLALRRVWGKPHACTEYNHPAPNTYSSEAFLLLAAYGALQDWDAIYVYAYAHSRPRGWDLRAFTSFFDIDQHPAKMATLPAAAALFLRGDVAAARKAVAVELPRDREVDLLRTARAWTLVHAGHVGIAPETALIHRVGLITEGGERPSDALPPGLMVSSHDRLVSDTGELVWDLMQPGRGVVTVNTARSKAVIGFGGGRRFDLGEVSIEPGATLQDGWAAITLTEMRRETDRGSWLLTATGYAENTGMRWKNAERSSVGRQWGGPPSRVEGIPATIEWSLPAARVKVYALDETGQRREDVPVQPSGPYRSRFLIGPEWRTLWYEIEVRP